MPSCHADESIARVEIDGFAFPLGVYPVESMSPAPGYTVDFEPADGDEEGEWEAWPDRYVYDIVVPVTRVEALWRQLLRLVPSRIYPILDYMGHDAYREVDPYISYELVGVEQVIDAVRRYRDFFVEDGMVGFGVACDDPFVYLFVDEHKIVTVRVTAEQRDEVEALLEAFGIPQTEEPAGADAAAHEHRTVLLAPPDTPSLLSGEEIVERLRDRWRLVLNVDPETNVDDEGQDLGPTGWRCLVRVACERHPDERYAEIVLAAGCLLDAEDGSSAAAMALIEDEPGDWIDAAVVASDRLTPGELADIVGKSAADSGLQSVTDGRAGESGASVLVSRWVS